MKYLIPPSEGKSKVQAAGAKFKNTNFIFKQHVEQIVTLLELIDDEDLTSIYGTSQEKSERFHRQNQDIFNSKCANAIERYTGIVYKNLDWESYDDKEKEFMNNHFYIFSGLFGLLKPMTLIPDYKLKMNVLSLQYHWNPILTEALKGEELIFDLLPQVYRKAYTPNKNVIQVEFIVENKGKKTLAGHYGKAVKGKFIKYLAENNIKSTKEFLGFEYDGFKWEKDHFVKKVN